MPFKPQPQRMIISDDRGPAVWGAMTNRGYEMSRFPCEGGFMMVGVYNPVKAQAQIHEANAAINRLIREIRDKHKARDK